MKNSLLLTLCIFISMLATAQPANDDPCGAIELPVSSGDTCLPTTVYSWTGATTSATAPAPACQWTSSKKDVWFKISAVSSGNLTVATDIGSVGVDFTMALYKAASCSGTFTYITCDDDSGPGNMPYFSFYATAGEVYYIRFWGFNIAQAAGEAKICVFSTLLSNGKVGVGVNNPTAGLDVNGIMRIRSGAPGNAKVLTSDQAGYASWQPVPAPTILPSAITGSGFCGAIDFTQLESMVNNTTYTLPFNETVQTPYTFDDGNNFSTAGAYTAPAAGYYHFEFTMRYIPPGVATQNGLFLTQLFVNGVSVIRWFTRIVNGQEIPLTVDGSTNLKLQASDVVTLRQSQTSGQTLTVFNTLDSRFSGYRIY